MKYCPRHPRVVRRKCAICQAVIRAIQRRHLRGNIGHHEDHQGIEDCTIHWDRAWVDGCRSMYLHVPLTCRWWSRDYPRTVVRVRAPKRLEARLLKSWIEAEQGRLVE
jgi:hypothetical protein